jgi:hypothetical protein
MKTKFGGGSGAAIEGRKENAIATNHTSKLSRTRDSQFTKKCII